MISIHKLLKYAGVLLILPAVFFSCSPAKFVPAGSYLLDKVEVRTNAAEVNKTELTEYLRQNPNSYILGLFRMQLGIYNMSGRDTTKWVNRTLQRMGQPPVIFDSLLTDISAQQLLNYHINKGYYNAQISTDIRKKNKKVRLVYHIKAGKPYLIRSYQVDVPSPVLSQDAEDTLRSLIQKDDLFDVSVLNDERTRLASRMRRRGYYNFNKDMLAYVADSSDHKVDLTMELRDYLIERKDTLDQTIFKKYGVKRVIFRLNPSVSALVAENLNTSLDTVHSGNYTLIGPHKKILTLSSLIASTFITPGGAYSDADVERTYSAINSLPPVKYTHISFTESAADSLDCLVTVAEAKSLTLSSQAELTFTEGYWGTAGNVSMVFRNLFKGAESLNLQGRLALEKQVDVIAQEWGGQVGIKVPRSIIPFVNDKYSRALHGSTEFRGTFNYQHRPNEFSATNVGGGVKYSWNTGRRNHSFDLFDLSYIYFPWISETFWNSFIATGLYNRYNYDDYFIMRMNYTTSYSNYNSLRPMRDYFTYRYSIETAGNLLYGLNNLLKTPVSSDGSYRLFNIRYSQYVRGEVNASYHQILDKNNRFVYHTGIGLGYPYGNAEIIPFERRFYSGGANSVRGWSESTLGPGTYVRFDSRRRDYNQMGDIKLDMNFEYRAKMFWVLESALFFDAGNVWTIRDYDNQPGGMFGIDTFWKQIAMAYGLGVRMDFDFVLFRIDFGTKLYDPAKINDHPWSFFPSSFNDLAIHLAIGYPF